MTQNYLHITMLTIDAHDNLGVCLMALPLSMKKY
jgi:hypothetical protein